MVIVALLGCSEGSGAADAEPERWPVLEHEPGDPVIQVRLSGGNVDCVPEVLWREVLPSPVAFQQAPPMQAAGTGAYALRVPIGWELGAEYYVRCCVGPTCGAGIGNKAEPFRSVVAVEGVLDPEPSEP